MGLIFGLIKRLVKLFLYVLVFAAVIVFIPNLPPYTKFTSIELEPTLPRTGPLAPNGALNNAQKLYADKVVGPEAFEVWKGEVYTTLATGEVVKISPGGHVTFVTKIGEPCKGSPYDHICGRPLGLKIDDKTETLYVVDTYYGIWKVNLKTDKKQLLVSPRSEINGRLPKLFNSLVLAPKTNGDFYWTDSSSDFLLKDGAYTLLSDPSGRLLYYDAAKNQSKVLLDDIWFPNGIVVSPDDKFLIVSETAGLKLIKYHISGPKKGKSEVFVAGLPGTPDNIRALPDGSGMLVGLFTSFDDDHPFLHKPMAKTPLVRKFVARLFRLIEIPFEFAKEQYPNVVLENIVYHIGHFKSLASFSSGFSGLLQIDWNGKIVASYFNTDGSLDSISDGLVYNDKLYLGSPHNPFIGVVPVPPQLKKAFASTKSAPLPEPATKERPKETKPQAKPVEAPKPKVQEKPKVEEKKEAPKPAKPVQEPPKPKQQPPKQPDPVQQEKPKVATPKPVEKKPSVEPKVAQTPKPQPKQEEKPVTPKPTPAPKPEKDTKPEPVKQEPKAVPKVDTKPKTEKPAAKPTEAPKEAPKPKTPSSETKQKPVKEKTGDKVPEAIPITEEIPSDTIKPNKETLKVIKRDGPAVIPNPEL